MKLKNNIEFSIEKAEEIREIASSFFSVSAKDMTEKDQKELLQKIMENASDIAVLLRAIS